MERRARTLSIIIPATFQAKHVEQQIAQCLRLQPLEIILTVSAHLLDFLPASAKSGCHVVSIDGPANLFAGRALGAEQAKGDILLFLGEDCFYPESSLRRFLFPIQYENVEVLLSREVCRGRGMKRAKPVHSLARMLNDLYGRKELREASLLEMPHALSRDALRKIGADRLAYPGEAHRYLASGGAIMRVQPMEPAKDDMPFSPELSATWLFELSTWEQAVIAEQVHVCSLLPSRGGMGDGGRRWDILNRLQGNESQLPVKQSGNWPLCQTELYGGQHLSVIIPACNEAATLGRVIKEVLQLEPSEIIVVVNGSQDQTAQIAKQHGTVVVEFPEPLGVDTGRAVGASLARGDILLFVDADFVVPAMDLYPFVRACQLRCDVALNDQRDFLPAVRTDNVVVAARQGLNLAANRKDLDIASMLVVPFALRRESFAPLGWTLLACPPKAQMAAMLAGLTINQVHQVDSFGMNRLRPEKHLAPFGRSPAACQIVGDHIEAFQLLAERGGFAKER
ncbi:glycosyltransferase family 2 protein [Brevibacillus choshinensis]|uniref:4,4'-diaponeurosporenoate glycosyltransferase n=1 Tax=Brevibacillus choshinensis TaxID=54911 RepID=A0ABX7FL01_BRECH|nr:glycosyltransferase [Brevibacillus choshinensis]QRG66327.1 glycosyltransferase [Brevibacillus choshinensis]